MPAIARPEYSSIVADNDELSFEKGPNALALLRAIPDDDWDAYRLVRGVAEALRALKDQRPGIYSELWDRELSFAVTGTAVAIFEGEPDPMKPFLVFRRHGQPYEGYWRQVVEGADDETGPWLMIPDEWVGDALAREFEINVLGNQSAPGDEEDDDGSARW